MYVKGKNRGGYSPLPIHPKKHHKPYRIRHIGLFFGGVIIVILSAFYTGYLLGQADLTLTSSTGTQPSVAGTTLSKVKSSLGFSFKYDASVFSAGGTTVSGEALSGKALSRGKELSEIRLKPRSAAVKGRDALSRLEIKVEQDRSQLDQYMLKNGLSDENEALISYFAPKSDGDFSIEQVSRTIETIGSVKFQKVTYKQTPSFGSGGKPVFSAMWVATAQGKPVQIYLQNLLNGSQIPSIYGQVFDTLHFGKAAKSGVLAETTGNYQTFDINQVSPAAVKIYHFVCGKLVVNDTEYGPDACDGGTGSGFLVSGDGYIATSGHMVVLDAADILVSQLLNNPALLRQFTAAAGLTSQQSGRSDVVASVLAKIYDLPAQKLRLDNRREITFVSLGNRPVTGNTQEEVKKTFARADSDFVKKAEIVAVNYHPKDLLVIEQNNQTGFSASDVALIKVNVNNSPYIRLADSTRIEQNSPVSLIGFPSDADNQLTDNSNISPSVTNGTISSIRKAKGGSSLLFQTDADASEGNSGGPAIDRDGKAFGLVTYRFKGGNETNAAKSYVRDIADFKDLVGSKNISVSATSPTQDRWEDGLDLFRKERYSKALGQFQQVQRLYPAHRLVKNYIAQAQQAILDGKDKKDPPYAIAGVIITGVGGIMLAAIATRLIIRHRRAHLAYKSDHLNSQKIISPPV